MVKIKKPIAKTLTGPAKAGAEAKIKKKKLPVKAAKKATEPVEPKKAASLKKAVKEAKVVTPVAAKKVKKSNKKKAETVTAVPKAPESVTPKKEPKAPKSAKPKKEPKATQKPLVVAPPESPAPLSNGKATEKKAKKTKKVEVEEPPKISAVKQTPKTTSVKKTPKLKAAKVAPKTEEPVEEAPKKGKKKNKKGKKATPVAAPATVVVNGDKAAEKPTTKAEKKKAAIKAFKKQKKEKTTAKPKSPQKTIFDAQPFDEDQFNAILNLESIEKIAAAVKELAAKKVAERKSIFSDYCYCLEVTYHKIPNSPKRMVKLNLVHSLVNDEDDVLIVVPDLIRGSRVDYSETIQHYQDLFKELEVRDLKIMPFNQIRTEYSSFEALRKLSNSYEHFLCDGRIAGQLVGAVGKIFQKARTTFHSVHLSNNKKIKQEIEKAVRRTAFKHVNRCKLISIPVGTHVSTALQVAENVQHVLDQLKTELPGGLANIRAMGLKLDINGTSPLPIYVSTFAAPETPNVIGPREQAMLKMKKAANESLSKFTITKDARVLKLTRPQEERKRKLKEARAVTLAEKTSGTGEEAEEVVVPAKKQKKEKKVKVAGEKNEKVEGEKKEKVVGEKKVKVAGKKKAAKKAKPEVVENGEGDGDEE